MKKNILLKSLILLLGRGTAAVNLRMPGGRRNFVPELGGNASHITGIFWSHVTFSKHFMFFCFSFLSCEVGGKIWSDVLFRDFPSWKKFSVTFFNIRALTLVTFEVLFLWCDSLLPSLSQITLDPNKNNQNKFLRQYNPYLKISSYFWELS